MLALQRPELTQPSALRRRTMYWSIIEHQALVAGSPAALSSSRR